MKEDVEKSKTTSAKKIAKRILSHENAILIIVMVAIIGALAAMSKGLTVSRDNISNIIVQSSTRGVAAMGQLLVVLTAGIDLSVGGIATMSMLLGASLMTANIQQGQNLVGYSVPMFAALPVMVIAGIAVGAINGAAVSRLGMPPLIVTLAMWQMTIGGGFQIGKGFTIFGLPEALAFFGQANVAGVPVPTIMFIAVAAVMYFVLNHTSYGRLVYASGGNPMSAWLSGIKVRNIMFSVYAVSGLLAALSALIIMGRTMIASMNSISGLEIDTIAAVVIGGASLSGGRGTVIGVLIGVFIIGIINNGMNVIGLHPSWQQLVRGGIIFAAVAIDVLRAGRKNLSYLQS